MLLLPLSSPCRPVLEADGARAGTGVHHPPGPGGLPERPGPCGWRWGLWDHPQPRCPRWVPGPSAGERTAVTFPRCWHSMRQNKLRNVRSACRGCRVFFCQHSHAQSLTPSTTFIENGPFTTADVGAVMENKVSLSQRVTGFQGNSLCSPQASAPLTVQRPSGKLLSASRGPGESVGTTVSKADEEHRPHGLYPGQDPGWRGG